MLRCSFARSSRSFFSLRPCLYSSLRGGPRTAKARPRSGSIRPTPIKSIRSSRGAPGRSRITLTPGRCRPGPRRQIELAGSRRDSPPQAANQHRHKSRLVFSRVGLFELHFSCLRAEDRATVGTDPSAATQGSKRMRARPKVRPRSLRLLVFLFEPSCVKSFGGSGDAPRKNCLQSCFNVADEATTGTMSSSHGGRKTIRNTQRLRVFLPLLRDGADVEPLASKAFVARTLTLLVILSEVVGVA